MRENLKKLAPYFGIAILLLSPAFASAHSAPMGMQDVVPNVSSLAVADNQLLASLGSFIVTFLGNIHFFGTIDLGSIGAIGAVSTTCPYGGAYPDGCSGAPVADNVTSGPGTYQFSNFFASRATQSGQTYNGTRPPWNVAGVDYPVGINAETLPAGTTPTSLRDPANVSSDPTLSSHCSWIGSRAELSCTSGSNLSINGYDFSLHRGSFFSVAGVTGTTTIENSYFLWGSGDFSSFYLAQLDGGALLFQNNVVDGDGPSASTSITALINYTGSTGGNALVRYNAFFRTPSRFFNTLTTGNVIWQFNYAEGITYVNGDLHGEEALGSGESPTFIPAAEDIASYSTFMQPSAGLCAGVTAPIAPIEGVGSSQTIKLIQVDHNVLVTNLAAALTGSCTKYYTSGTGAVALASAPTYTSILIEDNYIDPTGSEQCYAMSGVTAGTLTHAGDVNLLDGSSISDFTAATCHGHAP